MITGKYYDSIDNCPLLAWQEVSKTGKHHAIHKGGIYSGKKAKAAWVKIFDEYLKEFGIPYMYKTYLKNMVWAMDELARSYNKEKWLRPIAQIREAQAIALLSTGPNVPFSDQVARVSKGMGFQIDPAKTTVAQFYGYVNSLKSGS